MSKKTKIVILVVAVLLVVGGVTAAYLYNDQPEKKKVSKKAEKVVQVNPLTGLELTGKEMNRPFVVSTDNDSYLARPQAGLSDADILYEVPIEGCGSRYEPIYYSKKPGLVGAIRSCRPYIINIVREYKAVLVHNGKSPQAKKIFGTIDRVSSEEDFDIFHHEDNPNLPGNLYSYGDEIVKRMDKRGFNEKQDLRTFKWLSDKDTVEGKNSESITINYADGAYNTFKYDSKSKLYTKYVKQTPLTDANNSKEITCANILVQVVPFKMYDSESERLDIDMTAGGDAVMFTQGKAVEGTWSRDDLDSPTVFKGEEGKEFKMTPGVTWIQMIDSTVKFEY